MCYPLDKINPISFDVVVCFKGGLFLFVFGCFFLPVFARITIQSEKRKEKTAPGLR